MIRSVISTLLLAIALSVGCASTAECGERKIKSGRKEAVKLSKRALRGNGGKRPERKLNRPEKVEVDPNTRAEERRKPNEEHLEASKPKELYISGTGRGSDFLRCAGSGCRYTELSKYSYRDQANYVESWGRNFSQRALENSKRLERAKQLRLERMKREQER